MTNEEMVAAGLLVECESCKNREWQARKHSRCYACERRRPGYNFSPLMQAILQVVEDEFEVTAIPGDLSRK